MNAISFEYSIGKICRGLRKNQTPQEDKLWQLLRNRKFKNLKFRRQHPFIYFSLNNKKNFFVADFYCAELKLIIEIDGKIHEFQKEYDENRDVVLKELGLNTIRLSNDEIEKNVFDCLKTISVFVEG